MSVHRQTRTGRGARRAPGAARITGGGLPGAVSHRDGPAPRVPLLGWLAPVAVVGVTAAALGGHSPATDATSPTAAYGNATVVEQAPSTEPAVPAPTATPATHAAAPKLRADKVGAVPASAFVAYVRAQDTASVVDPTCRLPWTFLAAVGRIESDHGRAGGGSLTSTGVEQPAIREGSRVGPMRLPLSLWAEQARDGDGDGKLNPQDVDDAALTAGLTLCESGDDLSSFEGMFRAAMRLRDSSAYATQVTTLALALEKNPSAQPVAAYTAPIYSTSGSSSGSWSAPAPAKPTKPRTPKPSTKPKPSPSPSPSPSHSPSPSVSSSPTP